MEPVMIPKSTPDARPRTPDPKNGQKYVQKKIKKLLTSPRNSVKLVPHTEKEQQNTTENENKNTTDCRCRACSRNHLVPGAGLFTKYCWLHQYNRSKWCASVSIYCKPATDGDSQWNEQNSRCIWFQCFDVRPQWRYKYSALLLEWCWLHALHIL